MSSLPAPAPIREYEGVDRVRFEAEIRPAAQPAVLRGLGSGWPAVHAGRASPEALVDYLKRFAHAEPVRAIVGPPEIEGRLFYAPDLAGMNFTRGLSPLGPFLDRLLRDQHTDRPYAIAVQSVPAPEVLPGFTAENAIDLVEALPAPRLWLGNAIRVAPHFDSMENIGIVVAGRRRFTLFPPEQIGNLYMGPMEMTPAGTPVSLVDIAAPDLERFPRFATAAKFAQVALLEPGDAIYIPFHWWHAVDSLEPVNLFANYWWNPARSADSPYDALLHALLALGRLPEEQRAAWREIFDHLVFHKDGDPAAHLPASARGVLGTLDDEQLSRIRATLIKSLSDPGSSEVRAA